MKGIMVPLLILVMTGIVVGQQADPSSFRSTAYRQSAQNNTQGSGDFSLESNQDQVKPLDLSVSDEQIQGIRKGFALDSKFEPRDPATGKLLPLGVISGITLVHEKNLERQLPVKKMFGQDAGGGKITFELDDWALRDLESNKLTFEFAAADRGSFSQVSFYYKPPTAIGNSVVGTGFESTGAGPTPDDSVASSRGPFGQSQPGSFGLLPLPGPEASPGDVDFVGPVRAPLNQQVTGNNLPQDWSPNANTQNNSAVTNQGLGSNQTTGWTMPQSIPAKETLAEYQYRILVEKFKQDQIDKEELRLQEIARASNAQNNQFGATVWPNVAQPNRTPQTNNNPITQPRLTEQQIAERLAYLQQQQQIQAKENDLVTREAELARQKKEYQDRLFMDSLKVNRNDDIPQFAGRTGQVPGTEFRPTGPVLGRPDRFASNNTDVMYGNGYNTPPARGGSSGITPVPSGGIGKFTASIPGGVNRGAADPNPNGSMNSQLNKMADTMAANRLGIDPVTKAKKEKSIEGFIYFMLLCSLGLNIYLGLISRGFYVRYNELADELRETFTATM